MTLDTSLVAVYAELARRLDAMDQAAAQAAGRRGNPQLALTSRMASDRQRFVFVWSRLREEHPWLTRRHQEQCWQVWREGRP